MPTTRNFVIASALCISSFATGAQQLRDPTRPPDDIYVMTPSAAIPRARPGMVLQTVLLSTDRQAAIISGRLMSVGDTISGFRLSEIREGNVVMKKRGATRTLQLFPDVHISESALATLPGQQKGQQ